MMGIVGRSEMDIYNNQIVGVKHSGDNNENQPYLYPNASPCPSRQDINNLRQILVIGIVGRSEMDIDNNPIVGVKHSGDMIAIKTNHIYIGMLHPAPRDKI